LGYFWVLEGPIGKGKTIGKILLNIVVQDYDGQPLSSSTALVRTAICLNVFIFSTILGVFSGTVTSTQQMFFLNLTSGLIWGYLIGNAILLGVHPLKQGFHDIITQTLVPKEAFKDTYKNFLTRFPDFQRMQSGAFQSAAIGCIVMVVLSSFMNFRHSFSDKEKERIQTVNEAREEFPVDGFELGGFTYGYASKNWVQANTNEQELEADPTSPTQAGVNTEDLTYVVVFFYRTYNSFEDQRVKTDLEIQYIMDDAAVWAHETLPALAPTRPGQKPDEEAEKRKPEKIYFVFEKRINLTVLYQYSEEVRLSKDIVPMSE
jgi:uncharacterized RDD family membrane protein YckC